MCNPFKLYIHNVQYKPTNVPVIFWKTSSNPNNGKGQLLETDAPGSNKILNNIYVTCQGSRIFVKKTYFPQASEE